MRSCVDPRDAVHRVVQALAEDYVVGLPTESTYVWAASGLSVDAVEALRTMTPAGAALRLGLPSADAAADYLPPDSMLLRRFTGRHWPGPLQLISPITAGPTALRALPAPVQAALTRGDGDRPDGHLEIGVADHRVLYDIHRLIGFPLVIADAFAADGRPAATSESALQGPGAAAPRAVLFLDEGPTRYRRPSTRASVTSRAYRILQHGPIDSAAMTRSARPLIAVVCTGNTCRSPMAQAMLQKRLGRKFGDRVDVVSAGLAAGGGMPASPQGVEVMADRGLDLSRHRSRPLDESIVTKSDLILTLTRSHRAAILTAWPMLADRVHTIRVDGGDVADPVGMSIDVYQMCADQIEQQLEHWTGVIENLLVEVPADNIAGDNFPAGDHPTGDDATNNVPTGDDQPPSPSP